MERTEYQLVLSIDRDNDLGRKANVEGPVVGKDACIKAAVRLALADPTDSDSNSIFAAVKKFDEIKKNGNCEIAVLTGVGKNGYDSDRKVMQQLDIVLEKFPATGFVLITDGAEDDQVIPLLQGRAPIISKETVIVSQAAEVESAYYTIKNALQDPDFARTFILVPGLVIFAWAILASMGLNDLFFTSFGYIVGIYLMLKGTGLEGIIANAVKTVTGSLSLQKVSFPVYLLTIITFIFGVWSAFLESTSGASLLDKVAEIVGIMLLYLAISAICFVIGKSIDALQLKRAYNLRKYFLSGAAVFVLWYTLESARQVLVGKPYANLTWFLINVGAMLVVGWAAYKFSQTLDLRKKVTKLLVGLPIYSKEGKWIGMCESIKGKESIEFKNRETKKASRIKQGEFVLSEGRIIIV